MKVSNLTLSFLVLIVLLVQCQAVQPVKSERKQFKELYLSEFKLTYFRKLLTLSFNHSEAVKALIDFDNSGFTEPVLSSKEYPFIDSLVFLDNQAMVADSISSIGTVAEGAEGKHVLTYILNRLQSNWLDSIANRRYRQSKLRTPLD
jgi:hypothetical protein